MSCSVGCGCASCGGVSPTARTVVTRREVVFTDRLGTPTLTQLGRVIPRGITVEVYGQESPGVVNIAIPGRHTVVPLFARLTDLVDARDGAQVGGVGADGTVSHDEAREIVRAAWRELHGREPTSTELAYAQAIAWLETRYGRAGQFAAWAARGMYNWGALQRPRLQDNSCPQGTVPGSDAGNARCFYVFSSDVEAARRYLWELTANPHYAARVAATRAAMASGTPNDVAVAMKGDGRTTEWYEAPVSEYAQAITGALREIGVISGALASRVSATSATAALPLLLGLGLAGAGAWYLVRGRGRNLWRRPRRRYA